MKKLLLSLILLTGCKKEDITFPDHNNQKEPIQYGRADFKWYNTEIKNITVHLNGSTLTNKTTSGVFDFVLPYGTYPYSVNIIYREGSKAYQDSVKIDGGDKIIYIQN